MPKGIYLDEQQVKALHIQGLSDQGIANQIGAHKKSIARWRRARGLPSNVKQGRPKSQVDLEKQRTEVRPVKIDKEKAMALWNNGLLDTGIAAQMNCTKEAVLGWRKRNELPSNRGIFSWGGHKERRASRGT